MMTYRPWMLSPHEMTMSISPMVSFATMPHVFDSFNNLLLPTRTNKTITYEKMRNDKLPKACMSEPKHMLYVKLQLETHS